MPKQTHEDFGAKIGGAKKDLWKERGLYSSDLADMNERETDKFVKKDNIWKKPNYEVLIKSGIPVGVVYFIKKVRDSTSTKPEYYYKDNTPEKRLERQKEYIDTVRELQGIVENVKTKDDAKAAFYKFFIAGGYLERETGGIINISTYRKTAEKGQNNPIITNKLFKMMKISDYDFEYDFTRKAEKEQFGVPKSEKIPRGYEIRYNKERCFWDKDNLKPATWYVTKDSYVLKINFTTRAEALKWVQELAKTRGKAGRQKIVPPQFENIQRNGPDYRQGKNVDGKDFMNTFGFKGGEFGNWMSQNDRQASLNYGYDALKDLARALSIADKDISCGGKLSIAFGARGSGNAMAHYEPLRQVINLTKMRGAGSLGHEFFHALDDFLGRKFGAKKMLSEEPYKYPLFQKLIDTIKYKPATLEQAKALAEATKEKTIRSATTGLKTMVESYIDKGDEEVLNAYKPLKEAFLRGESGSVEKLNTFNKSVTGQVISKDYRQRLTVFENILGSMAENTEPIIGKVETDYFKNSKEISKKYEKDGDYWHGNVELTARAFATYIVDKLVTQSDYLVGHAESAIGVISDKDGNSSIVKGFPEGDERKAINAVFDEIVAELKRENILTHDDKSTELLKLEEKSSHSKDSVLDKLAISKGEVTKNNSDKTEKTERADKTEKPKKSHENEL